MPQRGPGPEFFKLLASKDRMLRSLVMFFASMSDSIGFSRLVGAGWGILLALEGATGAAYPGVTFREVHDAEGPSRLAFRAYWRQANCNPSLPPFLDMLRERYPDLSGAPLRAEQSFVAPLRMPGPSP